MENLISWSINEQDAEVAGYKAQLAVCQKQLETMKAENAELNNELKFIQTLRGQDEQIQILKSALKYATEIIHDEFCGKECHPIHKELKALADIRGAGEK